MNWGGGPSAGTEAKRLSPSRSARYLVASWPRTLLPAGSSGWRVRRQPALARGDRDDAATDAALARHPDLVEPVAGQLVEPGDRHHGQHSPAHPGAMTRDAGHRVHATVRQRGRHHREVVGGHLEGALAGVDVGGLVGVEVEAARSCRAAGRCRGCACWSRTRTRTPLSFMVRSRPANRGQAGADGSHFSSSRGARRRLVVAIAPALTSGFIVRAALSSTAISESNGKPVLLTPRRCRAASYPSGRRPGRTRTAWTRSGSRSGLDVADPERPTPESDHGDRRTGPATPAPGWGCSPRRRRRRCCGSARRPR